MNYYLGNNVLKEHLRLKCLIDNIFVFYLFKLIQKS